MDILQVPTKKALNAIRSCPSDKIAYCEDTKEYYKWNEKIWESLEIKSTDPLFSMSNYDLNKMVINQLEPIDISEKYDNLLEFHNQYKNIHYMLLCNELKYYTLFECDTHLDIPTFAAAALDIIADLGDVYSIEPVEGAIEIWIKSTNDEEPHVYYLFPYDQGVVYYG